MRKIGKKPKAENRPCKNCGRPLQPDYGYEYAPDPNDPHGRSLYRYTGEIRGYGYRHQGVFCTLECGYRYGQRCVQAGVALDRPDPQRAPKKKGS